MDLSTRKADEGSCTLVARLSIVTAIFGLLTISGSVARSAAAAAPVSIVVYSCLIDTAQPPKVWYRPDPIIRADEEPTPAKAMLLEPGIWQLAILLPRGRWYLRVASEHCAAFLTTESVDGEARTFLTGTIPGDSGGLFHRSGYLAVVLPYNGEPEMMWVSRDCSPRDMPEPVHSGRYFYFDGLAPGDYCFVYYIADGFQLSKHVHISVRGATVRISSDEIKATLEKYQRATSTPTPSISQPPIGAPGAMVHEL